jgi:hypothetical protein
MTMILGVAAERNYSGTPLLTPARDAFGPQGRSEFHGRRTVRIAESIVHAVWFSYRFTRSQPQRHAVPQPIRGVDNVLEGGCYDSC